MFLRASGNPRLVYYAEAMEKEGRNPTFADGGRN